jgi:choline dehydrogenase
MMEKGKNFTHVVVGAGSAGCTVAARIAENPDFNVLLLEAGMDCREPGVSSGAENIRRVPMKGQSEVFDDRIDWNVNVELPQAGHMRVAQAKIVGGGSSINGGTALRNSVTDCEEWVKLGNDAWGWSNVEPVYSALEKDDVKGTDGPHPLVRTGLEEAGMIQRAFVDGALSCGLSWEDDLNATGVEGVGASPVCRHGSRRVSAANTFIDPIRGKPNFTLMTSAAADRVVFSHGKAVGVVLNDGRRISTSTEVILSAGSIFSPAVLQRSGIGPAALLSSLGIPVLESLPVGSNLADHPCVPVVGRPKPGAYQDDDFSLQMQARWSSSPSSGRLDLQMVCFSYLHSTPPQPPSSAAVTTGNGQRSLGGTASGHVAGIGCNLNKPTSLGSVRIHTTDPSEQPAIAPGYFTTATDRAAARKAVRLAYEIMQSEPMQQHLSPAIGLTLEIMGRDNLLDEWITSQYSSTYHFTSSCRMAAREQGGVVDQSGRVYGVTGLRVADASVIPTIPAANTMWTAIMFAERIGRSIRDGQPIEKRHRALL